MGQPGKVVRELEERHIARMRRSADHYVANWQRYRHELRED
jgi:carbonic anhydrase/acetyltransferase-like protein (isoleucine patch superfamily)